MSTLEGWFENGWLKRHETSPAEIRMQLESADSDLANAEKDLSPAWQFAIAYNAGLRLCSVALLASGYVAEPTGPSLRCRRSSAPASRSSPDSSMVAARSAMT
jgi:hypothetical protein